MANRWNPKQKRRSWMVGDIVLDANGHPRGICQQEFHSDDPIGIDQFNVAVNVGAIKLHGYTRRSDVDIRDVGRMHIKTEPCPHGFTSSVWCKQCCSNTRLISAPMPLFNRLFVVAPGPSVAAYWMHRLEMTETVGWQEWEYVSNVQTLRGLSNPAVILCGALRVHPRWDWIKECLTIARARVFVIPESHDNTRLITYPEWEAQ
jgi:hypothetical protein